MTGGQKLLIAGIVGGSGLLLANAYVKAAKALQPDLVGMNYLDSSPGGNYLYVRFNVSVFNPSRYAFPIPRASVQFFIANQYVGTGTLQQASVIGASGSTVIPLYATIPITQIGQALSAMIMAQEQPDQITYNGNIFIGKIAIPFASNYALNGYTAV